MIATLLAAAFGILTSVALLATVTAFQRSRDSDNRVTRYFIRGLGLLVLGSILRGLYWDVFWTSLKFYDRDVALWWSDMTGATLVNVFFYGIMLTGVYFVLRSRQLMIPQAERDRWPWWKSIWHPDGFSVTIQRSIFGRSNHR